ncbi:MAG: nucleotide exchange factor GrpE [Candidatus Pacearchaeota archaeon]
MKQKKINNQEKEIGKLAEKIKQESEKIIKEEKEIKVLEEELKEKLEKSNKLAEERLNQLKYLQADFDNYRKQFDKEKEQIIKLANESLIKELIVILDDFDAAIRISSEEENKKGLLALKKKFFDILVNQGLKEIETLGKKFNPEFHEVLCKELSNHNEDEIIEEIQKGYMLKSKVIRTSKVKISKKDKEQNLKTENKFENNDK